MAKKKKTATTMKAPRRKPQAAPLPGMEDHAIRPLEAIAHEYAEIRDRRMELTEQEHTLKQNAIKLMHRYEKTIYRHAGVTIQLVEGEENVKVKLDKAHADDENTDDSAEYEAAAGGGEFAAERAAAVADDEG